MRRQVEVAVRSLAAVLCACLAGIGVAITPVTDVHGYVVTSRADGLTIGVGLLILAAILWPWKEPEA